MGNRAVVTFADSDETIPTDTQELKDWIDARTGVYLHWNGGEDSIIPFLEYCRLIGARSEVPHAIAVFTRTVSNFMGGTLSACIGPCACLDTDNKDNGTYVVQHWQIAARAYMDRQEQAKHNYHQMLSDIDATQPQGVRLIYARALEQGPPADDWFKGKQSAMVAVSLEYEAEAIVDASALGKAIEKIKALKADGNLKERLVRWRVRETYDSGTPKGDWAWTEIPIEVPSREAP